MESEKSKKARVILASQLKIFQQEYPNEAYRIQKLDKSGYIIDPRYTIDSTREMRTREDKVNWNLYLIIAIASTAIFSIGSFTAFGFLFDSTQNLISQKNSLCFGLFLAACATLIVCICFVVKSLHFNCKSNPSKNISLY
jgi:nitrate reductase NapE component